LECSRGIGKSKEHYSGLKESSVSFESSFPLVAVFDANIVISPSGPSYVKFGEPSFSDELTDKFLYEWKGVCVSHSVIVKLAVILHQSLFAVLLLDEKEG
jgi:hypothetical protein